MKNILIISAIVIFAIFLSLLIWNYFFSIYEVKFSTSFQNSILKTDSENFIEFYGINSFGQNLSFRNLEMTFEILEGKELVNEIKKKSNKVFISTNQIEGKVVLKVNSKFSLNPTIISINIKNL
ncbi:MAG: hypothetical protein IPM32_11285 [Ignavibacteriae bacterium]|nr:hypothetical protein [Ignavibacteriota bacterium]